MTAQSNSDQRKPARWEPYPDREGWGVVTVELPGGMGTLTLFHVNPERDYFGQVTLEPGDAMWAALNAAAPDETQAGS